MLMIRWIIMSSGNLANIQVTTGTKYYLKMLHWLSIPQKWDANRHIIMADMSSCISCCPMFNWMSQLDPSTSTCMLNYSTVIYRFYSVYLYHGISMAWPLFLSMHALILVRYFCWASVYHVLGRLQAVFCCSDLYECMFIQIRHIYSCIWVMNHLKWWKLDHSLMSTQAILSCFIAQGCMW